MAVYMAFPHLSLDSLRLTIQTLAFFHSINHLVMEDVHRQYGDFIHIILQREDSQNLTWRHLSYHLCICLNEMAILAPNVMVTVSKMSDKPFSRPAWSVNFRQYVSLATVRDRKEYEQ